MANEIAGVTVAFRLNEMTDDQIAALREAEVALRRAGVRFDKGTDLRLNQRDWEFDWSPKGPVELRFTEDPNDEPTVVEIVGTDLARFFELDDEPPEAA